MDFDDYQELTEATDISKKHGLPYYALGINGEAGEVAEKIKKIMRGDKELDEVCKKEIALELGATLWYLTRMAVYLGYSLENIARRNIVKLFSRKERNVIKGDGDER